MMERKPILWLLLSQLLLTFANSLPAEKVSEILCPVPEPIDNAWIHIRTRTYLSEITYYCRPGYRLVGNDVRKCGENGQWIGDLPECKETLMNDDARSSWDREWEWVGEVEVPYEKPSLMTRIFEFGKKVGKLVKATACNMVKIFFRNTNC